MATIKEQLNDPSSWTVTTDLPQVGKVISMSQENFTELLKLAKSFFDLEEKMRNQLFANRFDHTQR